MRTVFLASMVGVAVVWLAADGLATSAKNDPPTPPGYSNALYKGERACQVGLVEVAVELFPRQHGQAGSQPAIATAWVSVNGAPHSHTAAPRLRADGSKFRPRLPAVVGEVEVFVGLGQDCNWILAGRAR